MNFLELAEAGAVQSEQHGRLHVIRVMLPDSPVPQEFCSTRGFSDAALLAERGVNWAPFDFLQV